MATSDNKSLHPRALSVEQLNAIDLLSTGATDSAVAVAVGVHRVTVTKWRGSPTFAAGLNRRRAELFASVADRLRGELLPKAIAVIGEALTDGTLEKRTAAALGLLKIVPVSAVASIGPTDARDFVCEEADRRQRIDGTRQERLIAELEREQCPAARFADAWHDLEPAGEPGGTEETKPPGIHPGGSQTRSPSPDGRRPGELYPGAGAAELASENVVSL